jgi:ribose transport system permease protein
MDETPPMIHAPATAGPNRWPAGNVKRYILPALLVGILALVVEIWVPVFFGTSNLVNVGRQASLVGVVAVGMTFVVLTAGIDLSVGAIVGLVSVLLGKMIIVGVPDWLAVLAALGAGCGLGLLNALGITRFRLQPFIMTLATGAIFTGLALHLTDGTQLGPTENFYVPSNGIFGFLAIGTLFGIPGPLVVFIVIAVIGWLVLRYLPFGRYVYAVGGGQQASRLSGIRVWPVLFAAYAIAGFCAAIGAVIVTARVGVADPNAGSLTTLDAIAAVVIGGTTLMGGAGGMIGTVLGAFLLASLADILNLVGMSPFDQEVAKGVVIILAVLWASFGTSAGPVSLRRRLARMRE